MVQVFRKINKKNDGRLNFEEYLRHAEQRIDCNFTIEDLRACFETFDKDYDGHLSLHDLKRCMVYLGLDPTNRNVKRFFKRADGDNDGFINFKEFHFLVTKDFVRL